jgi:hypothetical protein
MLKILVPAAACLLATHNFLYRLVRVYSNER